MTTDTGLLDTLRHGLVVSVQPIPDGAMDRDDIVAAMACAAFDGGAAGLRIEGVKRVAKVRQALPDVPLIGLVKRDLEGSDVRITPLPDDVRDLAAAGADVIAIDATHRARPHAFRALAGVARDAGRIVMADVATASEARDAITLGAAIIGTTLSGYAGGDVPDEPDLDLVRALRPLDCFVVAEGRFNTPQLCRAAMEAGADCVTVGSALTRLELATRWFADAIADANAGASGRP